MTRNPEDEIVELLRNLLIVQLKLANIPHDNIRAIAGCSKDKVNEIAGLLIPSKRSKA